MKKVSLFVKENEKSLRVKEELLSLCAANNIEVGDDAPIVIAIGGDGTFLRAVHANLERLNDVCFVGINTGTLGFFSQYKLSELDTLVNDILKENFVVSENSLLEARIMQGESLITINALNEIRLENPFHSLEVNVYIDDEEFEHFSGNGLVVSSALGSSAYNRSLGGALVEKGLDILQLTEIAPIINNAYHSVNSPFVLNGSHIIRFNGDLKQIVVGYDHLTFSLESSSEMSIELSPKKVRLIERKEYDYIEKLKESFI